MQRLYRGRMLVVSLLVGSVFWLSAAPAAHADPHAMFYTAVGQRQLFFNILAALDQADYVEPATDNTAGAEPFSRNDLLERRTTAGIPAESIPSLDATRTDLSAILSRGITLEGQDLWTAYQEYQKAVEIARRNSTNELARKLCENALGIVGCQSDNAAFRKQGEAIVQDYIEEPAAAIINRGVRGAFSSGSTGGVYGNDQLRRKDILKDKNTQKQFYAYDPSIDLLRANAAGDEDKQFLVESLLQRAESVFSSSMVNSHLLSGIETNTTSGEPILNFAPDSNSLSIGGVDPLAGADNGEQLSRLYLSKVNSLVDFPLMALAVGNDAAGRAATSLSADKDGFKAHRTYDPESIDINGDGRGDIYGEIGADVTIPSEARKSDISALKNLAVASDTQVAYAPPEAINRPGQDELIGTRSATSGAVEGIQTTASSEATSVTRQGEVAGLIDIIVAFIEQLYRKYDDPKTPIVDPNPIAAHDEEGLRAALTAANPAFNPSEARQSGYGSFMDVLWQIFCSILPVCT